MKKIILSTIIFLFSLSYSYADYSNNPNCRGYGILETVERQNCLEANKGLSPVKKDAKVKTNILREDGKIDTSGIRNVTGGFFKKLGLNTDSKLFKSGKYSENK